MENHTTKRSHFYKNVTFTKILNHMQQTVCGGRDRAFHLCAFLCFWQRMCVLGMCLSACKLQKADFSCSSNRFPPFIYWKSECRWHLAWAQHFDNVSGGTGSPFLLPSLLKGRLLILRSLLSMSPASLTVLEPFPHIRPISQKMLQF